jgi:hypothetical protein
MWKYYNANVLGQSVNDCVVRAISKAQGKTWDETYEELSDIAQSEGILLDDVNFVEEYLDKRYKRTCHYSKTVGEFAKEHKRGTYLITMEGHITVIINGIIYDTFDCSDRRMWCAWTVKR